MRNPNLERPVIRIHLPSEQIFHITFSIFLWTHFSIILRIRLWRIVENMWDLRRSTKKEITKTKELAVSVEIQKHPGLHCEDPDFGSFSCSEVSKYCIFISTPFDTWLLLNSKEHTCTLNGVNLMKAMRVETLCFNPYTFRAPQTASN